jgi:8-oxo-dGTP pyrophosphatase MutT (NUDIX family)
MLDALRSAMQRPAVRLPRGEATREAAVAAIFYGHEPHVLFIRRATVDGDPWSGDIAFPGGRREDHDETLFHTAVRETSEELGIDLSGAEALGELDELGPVSQRRPLIVRPYAFYFEALPPAAPNREVAEVISLSLAELLGNVGRAPMPFEWKGQAMDLARVDFGSARLWGMTLRMVDDVLHRLDDGGLGLSRIGGNSPF